MLCVAAKEVQLSLIKEENQQAFPGFIEMVLRAVQYMAERLAEHTLIRLSAVASLQI